MQPVSMSITVTNVRGCPTAWLRGSLDWRPSESYEGCKAAYPVSFGGRSLHDIMAS